MAKQAQTIWAWAMGVLVIGASAYGLTYVPFAPHADAAGSQISFAPASLVTPAAIPPSVEISAASTRHLQTRFAELGYEWTDKGHTVSRPVPRIQVRAFPPDLGTITHVPTRKQLFFQSMLPLALLENERVVSDRRSLQAVMARLNNGGTLSAPDGYWLQQLGERYNVKEALSSSAARDELLLRVDAVPVTLVLAMGAYESGWGTSRFAGEGNNLFGHWTYQRGTGMVPNARNKGARHELAIFPDLSASVRAYMHNLNTHRAYADFRRVRAEGPSKPAETLAAQLVKYSERGTDYTDAVIQLIRVNDLERFDAAVLVGTNGPITVAAVLPSDLD